MAARTRVRTHQRTTKSGRTTSVRQHNRKVRPSFMHAVDLAGRSYRSGRRGQKRAMWGLGLLAAGETLAVILLNGTGFVLATCAVVLGAVCILLTGWAPR